MALLKSIIYVAVLGVAAHFVGEALPRRWFLPERFPFCSYAWERGGKIYDKLYIRAWKDHMPDMSRIMPDMVPKRVGKCPRAEEVWVLVRETCVAEAVHWALCLFGIGIWFFWRSLTGVWLTLLFAVCNLPFILIQRYNRPALLSLARRLEAREERKKNARTDPIG